MESYENPIFLLLSFIQNHYYQCMCLDRQIKIYILLIKLHYQNNVYINVICPLLFICISYVYSSPKWEYIKTEHIFLSENSSVNILNEHLRYGHLFRDTLSNSQ